MSGIKTHSTLTGRVTGGGAASGTSRPKSASPGTVCDTLTLKWTAAAGVRA